MGLSLIIGAICGAISAGIASSKGRNAVGWFFGGLLLGVIGLIIVAVLPNLKEQKAQQESVWRAQRRLREQLRQEQIKSETLRRYALTRLDTHDQLLGVDTRSADALLAANGSAPPRLPSQATAQEFEEADALNPVQPYATQVAALQQMTSQATPPVTAAAGPSGEEQRQWYYDRQGEPVGPADEDEVRLLFLSGVLKPSTLVWCEGMADWATAKNVPVFRTGVPT